MAYSVTPHTDWLAVVNPNAGLQKAAKDWPKIEAMLKMKGIPFTTVFTEHRLHGIALTREMIARGFRKLLVVGGDGTLNEVVNGVFQQQEVSADQFTLGMIPVGTGNDWCRMFHIPSDYAHAIEELVKEKTFIQDIGKVTYQVNGHRESRFLINMAGMGYDALVAEKTNRMKDKGKGGPLLYLFNVFSSLSRVKFANTRITIDGETREHKVFSMNVGICQYNGSGMKQLPVAVPDDGLLDVTIIRKIGRFTIIRNVANMYDGSFTRLPQVVTFRGKKIRIESTPHLFMEADGESLGHSPLEYEILPNALRVVIGDPDHYHKHHGHH